MRIISGTHKGRLIKTPTGLKLRPTTDLAREGLFNILSNILDYNDLSVLDLFSGTGSLSYEFASRGARLIHSVEKNPKHASFIADTAGKLGLDSIRVFRADVRKYISRCTDRYNLILADPPYNLDWISDIPGMILDSNLLTPEGILILEHPGEYNFSNHNNFSQHRSYGSVNFTFFRLQT